MGMITPLKLKACKKQYLFFKSSMHRQKKEQTYQTMNGRVEDCHEFIFWTAILKYGLTLPLSGMMFESKKNAHL